MKKFLLGLSALFIASSGAWAQTDSHWSLDQCIDHALQHNLDLKRQEINVKSTSQDHRQTKLDLLPNLNGRIQHELGSGRVLDRGTYEWKDANVSQGDMGVQSDLTLFNGLQGLNAIKMSKADYQMNMADHQALVDNVTIQVMTGYLDLLRNEELVAVADTVVEVAGYEVERMERLVEVGNEPKGRLLEVKAQLSAEKLLYTRAVNNRDIAKLTLLHVMNMTNVDDFAIDKPDLPDPSLEAIPHLDSVFQYALKHRPQIKSAEYGIESSERYLAIQKGARSPRLYASGVLYTNYSDGLMNPVDPTQDYPIREQVNNNQYKQVSVGLSLPIFNRWQVQTNINKAKLGVQDAEYQYDNTVLLLQQTVQQYHTEALAALENYRSAQEAVANSDEAYRFAEERFRVGTGTSLELAQARSQLYESAADMISSKYILIFYSKILDFYMGREIVF
jgi:outer membrane protein